MQLKKLTIHNLASIEDASIDFEHGPLAEDSRFLICGPTGSGKTTILDAICLALYGTTPRLNIKKVEGYVDEFEKFKLTKDRSDIKIDDTRMLMRRGSLNAFVEVIFTDKDDCNLKAIWRCNRAHNKSDGNIKDPEWNLVDAKTDTLICAKKSETLKEISDRIGLSFEQFCRTTMLAQGDFTKFLKSDEGEKSQILEKLTGTDIYSEISMKIHQIKTEKETTCQQIASKMEGVQLLSDEDKVRIRCEIEELNKKLEQLKKEENIISSNYQWKSELEEYVKQLNEVAALQKKQKEKEDTELFQKEDLLIHDWDRTQEQRTLWKERMNIYQQIEKQNTNLSELQTTYKKLSARFLGLEEKLRDKYKIRERINAYLEKESPNVTCYKQITLIESLVKSLKEFTDQQNLLNKSLKDRKANLSILLKQHDDLTENVKIYENKIQSFQLQLDTLNIELEGLNYKELLTFRERKEKELNQLKEYHLLWQQVTQLSDDLKSKQDALTETEKSIHQYTQDEGKAVCQVNEIELRLRQQEEVFEMQQRACGDLMNEYRSFLQVGDTCPLCGQTIHELATDEHFVSILKPIKELLVRLQEEAKVSNKQLADIKAKLLLNQRELPKRQQEYSHISQQYNLKQGELCKHLLYNTYSPSAGPSQQLQTVLEDAIKKVATVLVELDQKLKEVGFVQSKITKVQKDKDALAKNLEKINYSLQSTDKQLSVCRESMNADLQNLTKINCAIVDKDKELSTYLDIEAYHREGHEYIEELKLGAERYQIAVDKSELVDKHIQDVKIEINLVRPLKDKIDVLQPSWNDTTLLSAIPSDHLAESWLNLHTRVSNIKLTLSTYNQQLATVNQSLENYFSEQSLIDEERLALLSAKSLNEIETLRTAHKQSRDTRVRLISQLDLFKKNIAEHQQKRPLLDETITLESLATLLQEKKDEINNQHQLLGKLIQSLDTDKKNAQHYAAIQKQLDKATEENNRWGHLHKLFGSSDGKKFRNIAQSYVLEQLLANANQYLCQFTNRYEMECQPGSLTILLKDKEAGGVLRPTTTISGGESFFISLSLALGLSSLSRTTLSMDTLFIDEGFGTLDSTYLSAVIDALERLHQIGGKKIGIISHVESLKERITTQIQVTRVNSTLSKINVVSLI